MDRKLWVQHISGQGEKWEVAAQGKSTEWAVDDKGGTGYHYLPRSEYVPCDPPGEWEDVTGECSWEKHPCDYDEKWRSEWYVKHGGARVEGDSKRYRLRKVKVEWFWGVTLGEAKAGWAFIVERMKP